MDTPNVIPLYPKLPSKRFRINFDVRHYNGSIEIEASNEAEARLKFDQLAAESLIDHTDNTSVEVEDIEKVA